MNVVLCDDHKMFLDALAAYLESKGHHIIAAATSPERALDALEHADADICVMDLMFPNLPRDISEYLARISAEHPQVRLVVLSGAQDESQIEAALAAGASVASKTESAERILQIMQMALQGNVVRPNSSTDRLRVPTDDEGWARYLAKFLTPKEAQVLRHLVDGLSTTAIAREMAISYATARTHIQSILVKLGVHSKVEAVSFAVRHSLIETSHSSRTRS